MLADIFGRLREQRKIAGFEPTRRGTRHDFTPILTEKPRVAAALDVKGVKATALRLRNVPPWAQEFLMWCHLDGAITNQPSPSVRSITVNRLANDLVRRGKVVDAILFKDQRCGSLSAAFCQGWGRGAQSRLCMSARVRTIRNDSQRSAAMMTMRVSPL